MTMTTAAASFDVKALRRTWAAFDRIAHLRPIRGEPEYDRAVALMNRLLDVVGDDVDHALSGLLDLVGELVEDYDASHYGIEPSEPREVLRYLIEIRGLNWTVLLMSSSSHVEFPAARALRKTSSEGARQAKARGGDRPRNMPLHRGEPRAGGSLRVREAL